MAIPCPRLSYANLDVWHDIPIASSRMERVTTNEVRGENPWAQLDDGHQGVLVTTQRPQYPLQFTILRVSYSVSLQDFIHEMLPPVHAHSVMGIVRVRTSTPMIMRCHKWHTIKHERGGGEAIRFVWLAKLEQSKYPASHNGMKCRTDYGNMYDDTGWDRSERCQKLHRDMYTYSRPVRARIWWAR